MSTVKHLPTVATCRPRPMPGNPAWCCNCFCRQRLLAAYAATACSPLDAGQTDVMNDRRNRPVADFRGTRKPTPWANIAERLTDNSRAGELRRWVRGRLQQRQDQWSEEGVSVSGDLAVVVQWLLKTLSQQLQQSQRLHYWHDESPRSLRIIHTYIYIHIWNL